MGCFRYSLKGGKKHPDISSFRLRKIFHTSISGRQTLRTFLIAGTLPFLWAFTSPPPVETYSLHISSTRHKITLDGNLDEEEWNTAETAKDFFDNLPYDTCFALSRTEVRLTYDNEFLYVGAVCFDDIPGDFVIQSLKRDFSYPITDAFVITLNPFNDKTNGFSFGVNPYGVQREGLIAEGGMRGVSTDWDNKWYSEVRRGNGRWIVEMAIPFSSMRFKPGAGEWRINFGRNDLKRNESSTWVPVPRNQNISHLAFTGRLIWDSPPGKTGTNISAVPYAISKTEKDYQVGEQASKANFGMDAKIALTSSLSLDLTVNPDFSQVEVDKQVTNLSRFSIYYPEKRNFFIENSDLFSMPGFTKIRPFFSRRIGISGDKPVPIIAGARLNGKINQDWRIGLMNMQTEGVGELNLSPQNYSVAAFQRKMFERSYITGFIVNRQGFKGAEFNPADVNRVAGVDYNLGSNNGRWTGKVFYHHSFGNTISKDQKATALWLVYATPRISLEWNHEYVDSNYNADVGYVLRTGYFRLEPVASYSFFPKSGPLNNHGPELYASLYWDNKQYKAADRLLTLSYDAKFKNTAVAKVFYDENYILLTSPYDPSGLQKTPLAAGSTYYYRDWGAQVFSDFRKTLNGDMLASYGTYFNGTKLTWITNLNFRKQPWGIFTVSIENEHIRLPSPYASSNLVLIGPRIDLSFTRSLFLTTFIQYNTQADNVNINARMQWKFKPMSDIYIVYTDNYDPLKFGVKNRAVVVKISYWLAK